jgi:small subunit ribosomal protein S15
MSLSAKEKFIVAKKFQHNEADTGSVEVQVALFSAKISYLSEHLKIHKKDKHSRRGLIKAINNRKRLLSYLKKKNYESYLGLIKELGLRK